MKYHIYYVYILKCSDGSYYTGITDNIERRVDEHNAGADTGCYTYKRRPLILMYSEEYQFVLEAIGREKQIKRWSRAKKEALIRGDIDELKVLARRYS